MSLPGARRLDFSGRALVMGIVNCTPDSFYPHSRHPSAEDALAAALRMEEEGADIIDIGGESTRPGSSSVAADEETRRVVPLIEKIRKKSDVPISIDTAKAAVAQKALDAGADIINDVTALSGDREMASLAADRGVPVILMHMKGSPRTMQNNPYYEEAVGEIRAYLKEAADKAVRAGISPSAIIVDPGIGFGKRLCDNLLILDSVQEFRSLGFPVLIGASRKSFIDTVLSRPVEDRLAGSLAAAVIAAVGGAVVLRVHDVTETRDALTLIHAVRTAGEGAC